MTKKENSDYKDFGYGDVCVGFGEKPAVLVIDFQKSHTSSKFVFGGRPLALKALDNTCVLLNSARNLKIPIAICNTCYQGGGDMPFWKVKAVREQYFSGNPAVELDPQLEYRATDLLVHKTGPSMFYETKVQPFLTKQNVDTVIITGVNTSGCVRATVIDSFQRGYRTIVPRDCVGDIEEGPHIENLRDIEKRYADVVDLNLVLRYFAKCK